MRGPGFTAHWSELVWLNFEVPEPLVRALVGPTVALDRWCDRTYVSLVALRMRHLRLSGLPIPGFTGHPQVNFRTYVRCRGEPAVWFVRLLVPSRLVAAAARLAYGEPCSAIAIQAAVKEEATQVRVVYRIGRGEPSWYVSVTAAGPAELPAVASVERFFTERAVACRARRDGWVETVRVEHPPWTTRAVEDFEYAVDFARLYGPEWGFLNAARPHSVILATGSDVTVSAPMTLG